LLMHSRYHNPAGMGIRSEEIHHSLTRDFSEIAPQQEPQDFHAILLRIRKDQLVLYLLFAVHLSLLGQGNLQVFGCVERDRLTNQGKTRVPELNQYVSLSGHSREEKARGG